MKRNFSLLLVLLMLFSISACGSNQNQSEAKADPAANAAEGAEATTSAAEKAEEPVAEAAQTAETEPEAAPEAEAAKAEIRLAAMTGPTGMGMAKLLHDNEAGDTLNHYEFTLAGAADEITPLLVKGELDIAAVPLNLASVLCNKTEGEIQLMAVNTLGVLYLLDNDGSVQSLEDLKGRTVYATGKGSTPEYTLRYLLHENGIDPDNDLVIEFKSEPTEIVAAFKQAQGSTVAMLPQPYGTVAQTQVEGLHVALNLTEEWNKLDNGSGCFTGCVVVRRSFAETNPQAIHAFLQEYSASIEYANNHIDEAAEMMEAFGIVKAAVAKKAIPNCNLVFFTDFEAVKGYLQVLYSQNPAAVGGQLPGEDFYYSDTVS